MINGKVIGKKISVTSSGASGSFNKQEHQIYRLRGVWPTLVGLAKPTSVELLVVAGGGAGNYGGGGGAGGLIYSSSFSVSPDTPYSIVVGAGAKGGLGGYYTTAPAPSGDGANSSFSTQVSIGGNTGGTGNELQAGADGKGGSGGGGAYNCPPGSGTPGQGNSGGAGLFNSGYGIGGGGGGAGSSGTAAAASPSWIGGPGGSGLAYSITGVSTTYAGGGGGAYDARGSGISGTGGPGGGGNAGSGDSVAAANGTNGLGSGGGGSYFGPGLTHGRCGDGGNGVVIVAYSGLEATNVYGANLVYTLDTTTRPGYNVYKFTSGIGTITF